MDSDLVPSPEQRLTLAGQAANRAAARRAFDDYRSRKADNTLRRQRADLALFSEYLGEAGIEAYDLDIDPAGWHGLTWGIVEAFVKWQLLRGYAIGSVNVRLATVKVYAKLAAKAGALDPSEAALIGTVRGYSRREGKRLDTRRDTTRVGRKKADAILLSKRQAARLKRQPDTPQGRRDALLMCLLLDHGLRCGEAAALRAKDIDLQAGEMRFYRPKVDKRQTHRLTNDAFDAARRYINIDMIGGSGPLWRASRPDGSLGQPGLSTQAITARVRQLGAEIGVEGLSAHDCRHTWATQAARAGTDPFALQEAGGWSSLAMPRRYVDAAKVANQKVRLE